MLFLYYINYTGNTKLLSVTASYSIIITHIVIQSISHLTATLRFQPRRTLDSLGAGFQFTSTKLTPVPYCTSFTSRGQIKRRRAYYSANFAFRSYLGVSCIPLLSRKSIKLRNNRAVLPPTVARSRLLPANARVI